MSNTFGHTFRLTTYGESHGVAIGGIIDGCPAGLAVDFDAIQAELDRRRPGQSKISTPRSEADQVAFQSGIFEGKTTGTPIGFIIKNKDQRSKDYGNLKEVYRPSHADFTYQEKYGIRDYRGGGRSSARETACRVVAGALAKQILAYKGIQVFAYVSAVGKISLPKGASHDFTPYVEENMVRCPDERVANQMIEAIDQARVSGDSLGGVVHGEIKGLPAGLGEPVFDKFNAVLAYALMGINAVKGVEFGAGFEAAQAFGSELNDAFINTETGIATATNNSGGTQGGLTNGAPVTFNVAFKPVATINKAQQTVTQSAEEITLAAKGRHDPCVVPRAVPIVEAMAALVTVDMLLRNQSSRIGGL